MRGKWVLSVVFCCLFFLQGCETFKGGYHGAKEGFRKDWARVPDMDRWVKENMW